MKKLTTSLKLFAILALLLLSVKGYDQPASQPTQQVVNILGDYVVVQIASQLPTQ